MKMHHILALATLILLPFVSQAQKSETRDLSSFNAIALSGGFDVVLQEGGNEKIRIEASGIDLNRIETKVENNTLKVGIKNGMYKEGKVKLTITYRSLESLVNSGSSDIIADSKIKSSKFSFVTSGSGDFKGSLDVDDLSVVISGSGDLKMKGSADRQSYVISGSGDIDASELEGKSAEVKISGSGDVALNVDGPVNQKISGSGDVRNNH